MQISARRIAGKKNRERHEAKWNLIRLSISIDRLCGLVVRVLGYRSGGPGSIPGTNRKKKN
jgi:hypothetical protein